MNFSNKSQPYCGRSALLAAAALLLLSSSGRADDDESLARFVPAEAGLFAELRGASDLLTALTEPP